MTDINPEKPFQPFSCRHVWSKELSGSSFVGGHLSGIPAYFDVSRLTVIDTRILHRRCFDTHVPACFPVKCISWVKHLGTWRSFRVFYPTKQIISECRDNSTCVFAFLNTDSGMKEKRMRADRTLIYDLNPMSFLNSLRDLFSTSSWRLLPCASIVTIAGKSSTSSIHIASVIPNSSSFQTPATLFTLSAR